MWKWFSAHDTALADLHRMRAIQCKFRLDTDANHLHWVSMLKTERKEGLGGCLYLANIAHFTQCGDEGVVVPANQVHQ